MEKQTKTLARFSPKQLERFLVELANLQMDLAAIRRFRERFASFIPPHDTSRVDRLVTRDEELTKKLTKILNHVNFDEIENSAWITTLMLILRNLWTEPDQRQKEWGFFAFRYALYKFEDDTLTNDRLFGILNNAERPFRVPPPTPFEQALSYLVKAGDKARYCANAECPAPYFFVQRKNQRYCSEICAAPAQRELKRKWWAEYGEEWRAARQSKKPGKKDTDKGKASKKLRQTTKKGGK
jgi:hypothetical protein